MLKDRIITAVILAALFLGALFYLPLPLFSMAVATAVLIAAWEWANMAGFNRTPERLVYLGILVACLWGAASYIGVGRDYFFAATALGLVDERVERLLLIGCGWWALSVLWVQTYPQSAALWGNRWLRLVIGVAVLLPTWVALTYLRALENGAWLILLLVIVVALADIGGFFFGRRYGKRKLAPSVSPGKTWAGFWGGFGCNAILAVLLGLVLGGDSWKLLLAVIMPASLASVLGDLVESMVKRHRGIKDSSALLPGHGGLLDRVDSLTAAAPVFALALLVSDWRL